MIPVYLNISISAKKEISQKVFEMLEIDLDSYESLNDWNVISHLFPSYLGANKRDYCVKMLYTLNEYCKDHFERDYIKPFLQYILYCVITDYLELKGEMKAEGCIYEEDIIVEKWENVYDKLLENNKEDEFNPDEEYYINDVNGYLDFLFEDTDFLMLDKLFSNGQPNNFLLNMLGIDILEFVDLLPEDLQENLSLELEDNYSYNYLLDKLMAVKEISDSQERGYALEKYLYLLFEESGLNPRKSFKLKGEQIDGSFEYKHEIYLLEAKWNKEKLIKSDLVCFNEKVSSKSVYTRGVLITYSDVSNDAKETFPMGRNVRIVIITIDEIINALEKQITFNTLLSNKIRILAESGKFY